jgi:RNA polymerase sigma-70 factor (ECF subfamily)
LRNKSASPGGLLGKQGRNSATMNELADRLARGEPAAFAELYDACADRLHHYLALHLGSTADADDVVQETFARMARSRKKLRRVENLTAYVFAVARNEAARLKSKQTRQRQVREIHPPPALYGETYSDEAAALEAAETVRAALERLPSEQREIVELKAFGNLTLKEIAEVTALPPGTVATRYRTALEHLREWLTRNKCHE